MNNRTLTIELRIDEELFKRPEAKFREALRYELACALAGAEEEAVSLYRSVRSAATGSKQRYEEDR